MAEVVRLYIDMAYDDVAVSDWQIWANGVSTRDNFWFGATWPRRGLPRGTVIWLFV